MWDSEYESLNRALNDYFFQGRFEMLPVYLDLEEEAGQHVVAALDMDLDELDDFIGLTAARSLRFDKLDPYTDQAKWLVSWSEEGRREPPPFTVLLCALSIAAERMGADENFSANNYYERLFELLGVVGTTNQNKLRQYAKSTRPLWRALNMWLAENDFLLGRPTAKPLTNWQYASFALSQALVRDADRKRFMGLFETYDLASGEPVPTAEMTLLLNDWMTKSGPSGPTAWLRKLWSSGELRSRVVSGALDAFETWEERSEAGVMATAGPRRARLQWQLGFSGFPSKRARLALVVTRGGHAEMLEPGPLGGELQPFLEPGPEPDVKFLGPVEAINLDLLLLKSLSFTGAETGTFYDYVAKPIIPLARAIDGASYREVSRVSLFEEHAILCHKDWLEKVEAHLALCARPGHVVLRAPEMRGIPSDWCILRGVEIVRPVDAAHDNFHALNPIGSTAAIACVGGLKLGPGAWHVDAPPSVEASSERSGCKLEILREQFGEKDEVLAEAPASGDLMEVALQDTKIPAGTNLRAVVRTKSTELAETSFSLRSAEIPRPLAGRIVHVVGPGGFSTGTSESDHENRAALEGCLAHGDLAPALPGAPCEVTVEVPEGDEEGLPKAEWKHSLEAGQALAESCVIRRYHYWVYEPFEKDDDVLDAKMAECRTCNARALSRTRETAKGNRKKISRNEPARPRRTRFTAATVLPGQAPIENAAISPDTVFDGLCHLGHGKWKTLQRLASAVSSEAWFAHGFASELFALGHVETPDPFHSTTTEWFIPPPVLVIGLDGRAFLSGFHSRALLDEINKALTAGGASHDPISAPGQVTVHRWSGLSGLDLEKLLSGLSDPHGRAVAVATGLGAIIAGQLPSLETAWVDATPMHVEQADGIALFDVARARWTRVDRVDAPGAYRVGLHGTRYLYRNGQGTTRQLGHRLAKILAARAEGTRLHGYDMRTGRFTAALGVEPPGLFARALVASGGMLPAREGGRVVYANVDPSVANAVLEKLYGGDREIG